MCQKILKNKSLLTMLIGVVISYLTVVTMYGQVRLANDAFIAKLGAPNKESGLFRDNYNVWGSSVIKGPDEKYHMFSSSWPAGGNWVMQSTVLHSVSDTPEGPFEFQDEALPPRGPGYWDGNCTHNPNIHVYQDTFLLFYMGSHYTDGGDYEALSNKRIGLAYATSLDGPWTRFDEPILQPREGEWDAVITSNPAAYIEDNGSVTLVYKSWTRHATDYYANREPGEVNQLIGVARADHFLGEYQRIKEDRLYSDYPVPFNTEDPFIWKEDGKYHKLAKIFGVGEQLIGEASGGYHATSEDAINWDIDSCGAAWSKTVYWSDGTQEVFNRVERPQLLIQDGVPTHVYFACRPQEWGDEWYSICMPIHHEHPDTASIDYTDTGNYADSIYKARTDTIYVNCQFSTTTGRVVYNGIKFSLREMYGDSVVNSYNYYDKNTQGDTSGVACGRIAIGDITPSANLETGHHYSVIATLIETNGFTYETEQELGPITIVANPTGIQVSEQASFDIKPNPANNILQFTSAENFNYVNFYNLSGSLKYIVPLPGNSIDISTFREGAYIVEFVNNEKRYTTKLIIQH